MKRHLHVIVLALFVLFLFYDIVVWGSLPLIPEVGSDIVDSANREAPIAATYVLLGSPLDAAVPALQAFGQDRVTAALSEGFPRIRDDATVAMDLIFNTTWNVEHRWLKTVYWFPPLLLVATVIVWIRRPRKVSTLGRRR
ncbi:MAG: hypothetical protein ACTHK2_16525 [Dokdonella sp.]|uniref:hypothetical protein n=1 Tax=Dokdonella sp. TaxID=2291710 RepID=UPI003F7F4D18